MNNQITILFASIINTINKHRSFASLLIVFFVVIISDILFHNFYPNIILLIENLFGLGKETHDAVDLTFAPEIWGGVLATVLGTLIIVIAILLIVSIHLSHFLNRVRITIIVFIRVLIILPFFGVISFCFQTCPFTYPYKSYF